MWRVAAVLLVVAIVIVAIVMARRRSTTPTVPAATPSTAEHAVLARFTFAGSDLQPVFDIEDRLREAIDAAGAGEFDGNEVGGGECKLFMYGRDADSLFAAVEPVLRANRLTSKALVTKRYGAANDPAAREVTVDLAKK